MGSITRKITLTFLSSIIAILPLFACDLVAAQQLKEQYQVELKPMNGSNMSGTATVVLNNSKMTVRLEVVGASAGLVHTQEIRIGGDNVCPKQSSDDNNDRFVSTIEGENSYGTTVIALTERGDVSAINLLAFDRQPAANEKGTISYSRTFAVPKNMSASDLSSAVIVEHGIASLTGNPAAYDGYQRSPLISTVPLEQTIPAACGALMKVNTSNHALVDEANAQVKGSTTLNDEPLPVNYSNYILFGLITLIVIAGLSQILIRR